MRKILFFEMNEVPWRILDDFAARRPGGALAGLLARAKQFDTVCEDQVELDPWISWPTLHRGVIDEQHGVRHLGQSLAAADARFPPVWELLARAGRRVGVFGSLHSSHAPPAVERYAFYVPDFFSDETFAYPDRMRAFQAFNLLMTRRSARNVDRGIPLGATAAFLRGYATAGANWATARTVLAALVAERLHPHRKARRRSLQPLIGMDVFLPLVASTRPDFATFYTNHVAANMHRFWAAAYPDDARPNPMPAAWRERYAGEIDYAMEVMDGMLGRLRALAEREDYLLVAAGSIGQSGVPGESTQGFTTIVDLDRFMARLGVAPGAWKRRPAMVPCLSVSMPAAEADVFERRLGSLVIGPHRAVRLEREGSASFSYDRTGAGDFHLFVYFNEVDLSSLSGHVAGGSASAEELGLGFFRHEEEVACSGRHTPFGALFVYDPRRAAVPGPRGCVSTLSIAPALLAALGAPVPAYMAQADHGLLEVGVPAAAPRRFTGGGVERPVERPRHAPQPPSLHPA